MAGGVPAGRLNIEIVAEVARLQADLDRCKSAVKAASGDIARNAKAANDNLAAIGKGAGAGVQAFARDVAALKGQLDPAWAAQQRYNEQVQLGMKSFKAGAIDRQGFITHMRQINAELKGVTPQMQGVTGGAGRMRGGMQQLSFQIGDVTQQFALGQAPMMIFAQQGGQIVQAIGLMQGTAKGFIGFMAGPWGAVIMGAVTILGMLAFSHKKGGDAAKDHQKAAADLAKALADLAAASDRAAQSNWAGMKASYADADAKRTQAAETRKASIALLEHAKARLAGSETPNMFGPVPGLGNVLASAVQKKQIADLDAQIQGLNKTVDNGSRALNNYKGQMVAAAIDEKFDKNAAAVGRFAREKDKLDALLRRTGDQAAYANGLAVARTRLEAEQKAVQESNKQHNAHKAALSDEQKAYEKSADSADQYITQLQHEIAALGMSAKQLKVLEVQEKQQAIMAAALATGDQEAIALARQKVVSIGLLSAALAEGTETYALFAESVAWATTQLDKQDVAVKKLGADWLKQAVAVFDDGLDPQPAFDLSGALDPLLAQFGAFDELMNTIGDSMADAFGKGGAGVANMVSAMTELSVRTVKIDQAFLDNQIDAKRREQLLTQARLDGLSKTLHAAKSLFKEQSLGYKMVDTAEKALAAFRAVQAVKDAIQTAKSVAAGAARMFEVLGPFGFAAVAAMMGVMAALGFSGGSSTQVAPPTPEDIQARVGAGTVLGDNSAQSASIANALDIMASNSNSELEYSNEAVKHLRDINTGISGLTAAIARQLNMSGGAFDTSGFKLGSNSSSGLLGLGIFGSTTTKSLYDQGLNVFSATVDDILSGRFNAQVYSVIETIKKSSGFLGIGGSTKTTYSTVTGAAPADIERQMQMIVADVAQGVVALAGQIGLDVADSIRNVAIPAAQMSFADMSGEDIEAALSAYFSSVADAITQGGLSSSGFNVAYFQKAGEGLFETLSRLTRSMMTVTSSLKSIGMEQAIGTWPTLMQKTATEQNLVNVFGDLDAMQEAIAAFAEDFLSEAERMAPVIAAVRAEMERLGFAGVTTNDQFKSLVQSMDLTGFAGRETFAALLAVGPAFAQVNEYLATLGETAGDTSKTLEQLAAIEKERQSLQLRLLDLTDVAAAQEMRRAAEMAAALSDANRAILEQIFSTQDAATEAKALADALAAQATETERLAREAEAAAAAMAQTAAAIASQYQDLTLRLLDITDTSAAEAMRRDIERAGALSDENRALLELIFSAQDAAAEASRLADALAEQAAETARLAEEAEVAAQAMAAIANEYQGLTLRLLDLTDVTAALNMRRELERSAALSDANRALLEQIYTAEDAAIAAKALADAQAAQAAEAERAAREAERMADEMARAAEAMAQAAAAIAKEYQDLTIRLLDLTDEPAAQAMRRQLELAAALSEANRAILLQIYTAEDVASAARAAADAQKLLADAQAEAERVATEAAKEAAQRVADARGDLVEAYKREFDVLDDARAKLREFGDGLRAYQAGLFAADQGTAAAYRQAQVKFMMTSALAQAGDVTALGQLQGVSSTFLDASKSQATSALQYQRDVAAVARAVESAIGVTDRQVDLAQSQLDQLTALVSQFVILNPAVLSVHDAIVALQEALTGAPAGSPMLPAVMSGSTPTGSDSGEVAALRSEISSLTDKLDRMTIAVEKTANEGAKDRTFTGIIEGGAWRTREVTPA